MLFDKSSSGANPLGLCIGLPENDLTYRRRYVKCSIHASPLQPGRHGRSQQSLTQTHMVHILYRGAVPALTYLMGGQIQLFFDAASAACLRYPMCRRVSSRALQVLPAALGLACWRQARRPKTSSSACLTRWAASSKVTKHLQDWTPWVRLRQVAARKSLTD